MDAVRASEMEVTDDEDNRSRADSLDPWSRSNCLRHMVPDSHPGSVPMSWVAVCTVLVSSLVLTDGSRSVRMQTCKDLVKEAKVQSVAPEEILGIAWHESRFRPDAVSRQGAIGPLQILPKYFCPNADPKGCDTIKEGVKAWKRYRSKYQEEGVSKALCHYNGGRLCGKRAAQYAVKVISKMEEILRLKENNGDSH